MEKRGVLRGISPLQADKFLSAKFWTDPLVFGLSGTTTPHHNSLFGSYLDLTVDQN